ncbi:colicin V synthesis protein [Budviciaceae bacterium BWR-B9]|uniref:Colicin V synthesis protein n=1 Tax=Limnobaculum allomyrinae TaxID=2791986 RepID=A0ABS1IV98_9GAMM|nr:MULTISPECIES: hypothetical protein [Limnobaculum]MBK5145607.1 colicin V synthesis protein [Limnobaculum allomyrinae]MBV7694064.1 hypothetical protein [Limnobaculum sp. M2-1]
MRELNELELTAISGGYGNGFVNDAGEFLISSILGAAACGAVGAIIGGKHGGDGGGALGFGIIGQGVGMVSGGLIGMVAGFISGGIVGKDKTVEKTLAWVQGVIDGTFNQ